MRRVDVAPAEFSRLAFMIDALGGKPEAMIALAYPGDPHSKERAKHARRGRFVKTYQPKSDAAAEARTAGFLVRHFPPPRRMAGNVALAAIFYRSDRHGVDTDNLIKHVCDSANGVVWLDDAQATATAGVIELDAIAPRTVLAFAPHISTMLRGDDAVALCAACGTPFPLAGAKRFCGVTCAARGRRKDFIPFEVVS